MILHHLHLLLLLLLLLFRKINPAQTLKQNTQVKSPGSEKEKGGGASGAGGGAGSGAGGGAGGGAGSDTTAAAETGRGLVRKESVSTQTPSSRSGAVGDPESLEPGSGSPIPLPSK